jgi:hypothetical protein
VRPKNPKPVVCKHPNVEAVEGEQWKFICADCGLRFMKRPYQWKPPLRKPRSRR